MRNWGKTELFAKFRNAEHAASVMARLQECGLGEEDIDVLLPVNDGSDETGPSTEAAAKEKKYAALGALIGATLGSLIIGGVFAAVALRLGHSWAAVLVILGIAAGIISGVEFGSLIALRLLPQSRHKPEEPVERAVIVNLRAKQSLQANQVRLVLIQGGAQEIVAEQDIQRLQQDIPKRWSKVDVSQLHWEGH